MKLGTVSTVYEAVIRRTQVLADPSNGPDEPDNVQTRSGESLRVQGTPHCYVRWDVTQHLIFALVVQLKPSECSEVSLANLKLEDCQLGNNYPEQVSNIGNH